MALNSRLASGATPTKILPVDYSDRFTLMEERRDRLIFPNYLNLSRDPDSRPNPILKSGLTLPLKIDMVKLKKKLSF